MESSVVVSSKLPSVGASIFSTMSQLALQHQAINLSQGFPDFECSAALQDEVTKAIKNGFNQYAPMAGVMKLRELISEKTQELYSLKYNADTEITITSGATQAIYTAISAFIKEGDEVIVFEPAYDCYVPAIEVNGGKAVYVSLKYPDFSIDWENVKKLVRAKTKMIIVNNPNNPTGALLNASDLEKLYKITQNTDIIVLSDEVYEHIVFDGFEHQSIARYPRLAERSVIISSFGKTYHTTGWKLGYCIAPEKLMIEFRKVHQYNVFAANHPMQIAYSKILEHKDLYLQLNNFYQEKRDYFLKLVAGSKFKALACNGSYFALLKYDKISKEKDTEFAVKLIVEHKIASVPISVFYHNNTDNKLLRFCFAKNNSTLEKAAEILLKIS
jgi:methionine transaminase